MFSQKIITLLIVLLFASYLISIKTGIYWAEEGLDSLFHLLGGAIIAGFLLAHFQKETGAMSRQAHVLFVVGGTALAAVLWEFLEWTLDRYVLVKASPTLLYQVNVNDTLLDLFMGLVGSFAVAIFSVIFKRRS